MENLHGVDFSRRFDISCRLEEWNIFRAAVKLLMTAVKSKFYFIWPMGRPFEREISFIPATIAYASAISLEDLPRHISEASSGHVILVGAGGSLSAAEFCQKLFDNRGVTSQAMTPQFFIESQAKLPEVSVFIFTARGNNKDVLAVFREAQIREAKKVVVVCAAKRSKVAGLAGKCARAYVYGFQLSSGRDGYLATNSLVATCILLARAFGKKIIQPGCCRTLLRACR